MTKLDRAINNDKQLNDLSQYYSARNITPVDLFRLLDKVIEINRSIYLFR